MKADIKWFVEIFQERSQETRIEACGSLREAREMVERVAAGADFDGNTDSITIYRGEDWASAKLFE